MQVSGLMPQCCYNTAALLRWALVPVSDSMGASGKAMLPTGPSPPLAAGSPAISAPHQKEYAMEIKSSDVRADVVAVALEPPVVTELGSLTRLTLGQGKNDTADMKKYYY